MYIIYTIMKIDIKGIAIPTHFDNKTLANDRHALHKRLMIKQEKTNTNNCEQYEAKQLCQ